MQQPQVSGFYLYSHGDNTGCGRKEVMQLGPVVLHGSSAAAWQWGLHRCPGRAAGALQSSGLSLLCSQRPWLLAWALCGGHPGTSDSPCLLLASLRLEPGEAGGSSSSGDQNPPPAATRFATHASRARRTHKQPPSPAFRTATLF